MLDEQMITGLCASDMLTLGSTSSEDFIVPDDVPLLCTSGLKSDPNIVSHLNTPPRLRSLATCDPSFQSQSELELFQHFMTSTSKTMPLSDDPDICQLWTVKVPQMALRCSFLLESVAMVAAFHLRSQNPADESLVVQSHHFYGLALRSTRDELSRISPSNAEQLVISSLLLSIASWRFRTTSTEAYTVPNEALQTSIAAVQVYLSTWSWLDSINSSVHRLFSSLDITGKWSEVHNKRRYSDVVAMLDGLEDTSSEGNNGEEFIRHLMVVHSCLYQAESKDAIRHRVVQAAFNPPQSLTQGLQEKDPRALAVWARIMSLWTEIEETWWTADIAEYEMSGVQQIFEDCGYDEELLTWPLARFAWDQE
ncbi:uncharacterized protein Z520_07159 [Fonsecaea multimorphosa CBS 102226]|uniref:Transcription factor domain-containing protein n=1 Tax=Fonsecaea multimorphosa CBS 102226 TaxID=1442371 RepID=A0A0D2H5C7_9EURO|nr:uncharacterized protein Z520_07159 [Fonsecaea multimorphosa CBS 102226]KIX97045.1 hypothetical protein Z520_07159 [Fonsecaea multimorphosa CBS 102226]OAL22821.1 hypothetical protein AYO22_06729 [Fonsecaea multimorphosa]